MSEKAGSEKKLERCWSWIWRPEEDILDDLEELEKEIFYNLDENTEERYQEKKGGSEEVKRGGGEEEVEKARCKIET